MASPFGVVGAVIARIYVIVSFTVLGRYGGNSYYVMDNAINVAIGRRGGKILVGKDDFKVSVLVN